tara:strand:+ start:1139 stop:2740 length:1602 start_codon:yes stop_codon:yes gene_type:complete
MITYSHRREDRRDEEQAMNATKREIQKLINHGNKHISRMNHHLSKNVGVKKVKDSLEQHKYARLEEMTYKLTLDRDVTKANEIKAIGAKYIPDFENFKVVPEFRDGLSVVFENTKTGEIVFAVRGSDTKFFDKDKFLKEVAKGATKGELTEAKAELERIGNINDWWINFKTAFGIEAQDPEYKRLYEKLLKVQEIYGVKPTLVGHSKGGRQAIWLGEQTDNSKVKAFDPADSPLVNHTSVKNPPRGMKMWRTPYALVSGGAPLKEYDHIEVIEINSRPEFAGDPKSEHEMGNYYADSLDVDRVTKTRQRLESMKGAGKLVGGIGLALGLQEIALPKDEFNDPKSQFYASADAFKMAFPEGAIGDTMVDLVSVNEKDRQAFRQGVMGLSGAVGIPKHIDDRLFKLPWAEDDPAPYNPDNDSFLTTWLDEIHDSLGKEQRRDAKYRVYEHERYNWARNEIENLNKTPDEVNKDLGDEFVKRDERGFVIYDLNEDIANYRYTDAFTGQPKTGKTLYQQEIARREYTHPYKTEIIKI